jgi:DNA topoisomerase-1
MVFNGKFGPYVKCGGDKGDEKPETRSLPAGLSPLDVTFEQALELLAQPKAVGRGRGAPRAPLKVFEASPVTGNPVQLLSGRFGAYVTDGTTNATLPRGTSPDELTFEYALNLLKVRAEQGPSPRQLKKAAAAAKKKAAAPKKAAPKKKAAKKAATKAMKKEENEE